MIIILYYKKYYFNDIFKTNIKLANSFVVNQIKKLGKFKFQVNILLKIISIKKQENLKNSR